MKEISLTQGHVALVDDEDFYVLNQFNWRIQRTSTVFYARRTVHLNGKRKTMFMHRQIMGETGDTIDHKNGDGLDNRRSNLRFANGSQQAANSKLNSRNTSGFKGVYWDARKKRWSARIKAFGKRTRLGTYHTAEDAHTAYLHAAKLHFGEFANTA